MIIVVNKDTDKEAHVSASVFIIADCTGTLKMSTAVIPRAVFTCPGRAGPVFRLDP